MIIYGFALGLIFSLTLTPVVRFLSKKWGILAQPDEERRKHAGPIPQLGGIAIFLALALAALLMRDSLLGGFLLPKHLAGILLGGAILSAGGALDDKFNLRPFLQLAFPAMAALVVIASGVGISYVTNPLGGLLQLDAMQIKVLEIGGVPYHLSLPADLFTFIWLMMMTYTTKILDGLDGLVAGLAVIGAVVLALMGLSAQIGQPELSRFAMMVAGAFAGFLFYNARPASIFLGEGGSTLAGYLLGVMAIVSGAKIGITLLIVAVPFLDMLWMIFSRTFLDRKSFAKGDMSHLHFLLQELGLSPGTTVAVFWLFAAAFGAAGLFLPSSRDKALAFLILAATFILTSFLLRRWKLKRRP